MGYNKCGHASSVQDNESGVRRCMLCGATEINGVWTPPPQWYIVMSAKEIGDSLLRKDRGNTIEIPPSPYVLVHASSEEEAGAQAARMHSRFSVGPLLATPLNSMTFLKLEKRLDVTSVKDMQWR